MSRGFSAPWIKEYILGVLADHEKSHETEFPVARQSRHCQITQFKQSDCFVVSDKIHFVTCYCTDEALNEYSLKFPGLVLTRNSGAAIVLKEYKLIKTARSIGPSLLVSSFTVLAGAGNPTYDEGHLTDIRSVKEVYSAWDRFVNKTGVLDRFTEPISSPRGSKDSFSTGNHPEWPETPLFLDDNAIQVPEQFAYLLIPKTEVIDSVSGTRYYSEMYMAPIRITSGHGVTEPEAGPIDSIISRIEDEERGFDGDDFGFGILSDDAFGLPMEAVGDTQDPKVRGEDHMLCDEKEDSDNISIRSQESFASAGPLPGVQSNHLDASDTNSAVKELQTQSFSIPETNGAWNTQTTQNEKNEIEHIRTRFAEDFTPQDVIFSQEGDLPISSPPNAAGVLCTTRESLSSDEDLRCVMSQAKLIHSQLQTQTGTRRKSRQAVRTPRRSLLQTSSQSTYNFSFQGFVDHSSPTDSSFVDGLIFSPNEVLESDPAQSSSDQMRNEVSRKRENTDEEKREGFEWPKIDSTLGDTNGDSDTAYLDLIRQVHEDKVMKQSKSGVDTEENQKSVQHAGQATVSPTGSSVYRPSPGRILLMRPKLKSKSLSPIKTPLIAEAHDQGHIRSKSHSPQATKSKRQMLSRKAFKTEKRKPVKRQISQEFVDSDKDDGPVDGATESHPADRIQIHAQSQPINGLKKSLNMDNDSNGPKQEATGKKQDNAEVNVGTAKSSPEIKEKPRLLLPKKSFVSFGSPKFSQTTSSTNTPAISKPKRTSPSSLALPVDFKPSSQNSHVSSSQSSSRSSIGKRTARRSTQEVQRPKDEYTRLPRESDSQGSKENTSVIEDSQRSIRETGESALLTLGSQSISPVRSANVKMRIDQDERFEDVQSLNDVIGSTPSQSLLSFSSQQILSQPDDMNPSDDELQLPLKRRWVIPKNLEVWVELVEADFPIRKLSDQQKIIPKLNGVADQGPFEIFKTVSGDTKRLRSLSPNPTTQVKRPRGRPRKSTIGEEEIGKERIIPIPRPQKARVVTAATERGLSFFRSSVKKAEIQMDYNKWL